LICHLLNKPTHLEQNQKSSLQKHFKTHLNFKNDYNGKSNDEIFSILFEHYKKSQLDKNLIDLNSNSNNDDILEASYKLSDLIASNYKFYNEGEFI
jgi:hypothetical protein